MSVEDGMPGDLAHRMVERMNRGLSVTARRHDMETKTSTSKSLPLACLREQAERIVASFWYDCAGMESREAARKIIDALVALEDRAGS